MVEPTLAVSANCSCLAESTRPSGGSNADDGHLDIPRWNIGYGRKKIDRVEAWAQSGHTSAPAESGLVGERNRNILVRQLQLKGVPIGRWPSRFESNPSTGKLKQCAPLCFQVLQIQANQTGRDIKVTQADTFERILKSGYPIQDHLSILTSPPSERLESNLGIYDFMPLGVAQFSQSRPISGTLWAMSQITLASLSLWQYQKVEDSGLSIEAREDAKALTNTLQHHFTLRSPRRLLNHCLADDRRIRRGSLDAFFQLSSVYR